MQKQIKKNITEELVQKLFNSPYFYIINEAGMKANLVNSFRKACFQKNLYYRVVRNTLLQKALEIIQNKHIVELVEKKILKGFSGLLICQENGITPAKFLLSFRKEHNITSPLLKIAYIDGDLFIGNENLEILGKFKTKEELIGELLTLLKSPLANVVSSLNSKKQVIYSILDSIANKKSIKNNV